MVDFYKAMAASPKHSRRSPSGFKAIEICPSYVPTKGDSAASIRGSKLHSLMEKHGVEVKDTDEFRALDSGEQIEMITKIADYLGEVESQLPKGWNKHLEIQLDLTSYDIKGCEFGTADVIIEFGEGKSLHGLDYKFGWIEVDDAEYNIQVWIYVLGAFAHFPRAQCITFHILQPQRDEISTHTFDRKDIPMLVLRARTIADRAEERSGIEFYPTTENCSWCGRKATCTVLHEFALRIAKKTSTLSWPDIKHLDPQGLSSNSPGELLEHGHSIFHLAKIMESWADQVKRRLSQLSQDGAEIRGLKIRTIGGKSSISHLAEAVELICKTFHVTRAEILAAAADISLTKAENYVGSLAPVGKKQSVKDELRAALAEAGLIYKSSPSAYLVDSK